MKKLFLAAATVFASMAAFAQDEEPIQYIPKHEFTVNVFGGLNLGSVGMPGQGELVCVTCLEDIVIITTTDVTV